MTRIGATNKRMYRQARPGPADHRSGVQVCLALPTKGRGYIAAPPELRELGCVLQRLRVGDTGVDLSALPAAWQTAIRAANMICRTRRAITIG